MWNSLIATIQFQRPDLFVDLQNSSVPIMLNPPHGFYNDGICNGNY